MDKGEISMAENLERDSAKAASSLARRRKDLKKYDVTGIHQINLPLMGMI